MEVKREPLERETRSPDSRGLLDAGPVASLQADYRREVMSEAKQEPLGGEPDDCGPCSQIEVTLEPLVAARVVLDTDAGRAVLQPTPRRVRPSIKRVTGERQRANIVSQIEVKLEPVELGAEPRQDTGSPVPPQVEIKQEQTGHASSWIDNESQFCETQYGNLVVQLSKSTGVHKHTCADCGLVCTSKTGLSKHSTVHTRVQQLHECSECSEKFVKKYDLTKHRKVHTTENIYECSECSERYISAAKFLRHIKTHNGEKPYECSECNKIFADRSTLSKHRRKCVKPYVCSECSKKFTRKYDLTSHHKIHTGEGIYECSECSKRYLSAAHLARHFRTHTGEKPFECSECYRRFADTSSLAKHRRIHTGERPFKCSMCGSVFADSSSLFRHRRLHTGEKPYSCTECSKTFFRNYDLKHHFKKHSFVL